MQLLSILTFLGCGIFIAADQASGFLGIPSSESNDSRKPVGDFRKDVNQFIKRSKRKSEPSQRFGAILDLCQLHYDLVTDPRFETNRQLQGFRAMAASRLKKCKREIENEIKKLERENKSTGKISRSRPSKELGGDQQLFSNYAESNTNELLDGFHARDMQLATEISGGPIQLWTYTGGHFAGPLCDYGPDLVRLIENTINPDSWRSNGGNGVIHYYQPLRILVVSSSSQVHDDLTGLLRILRTNQ